ncbi:MAG TPA: DUF1674 domain-containing protein [Pseudoxanthomonas sp.]|nr:DUF1674 domain-containing protein [Pseudoxanthomonas sp.]
MIGETPPVSEHSVDAVPATQKPVEGDVPKDTCLPRELGGRDGPEPTRYGDWEKNGRCIDF